MNTNDLQVREKEELRTEKGENTEIGRYFVPLTDILESDEVLQVTMDMPGVKRENVDIQIEKNVLTVTGKIDFQNYEGLKPIYTEYAVGNFSRTFSLSRVIDQSKISASMSDGVLSIDLPKAQEAQPKKIQVG